MPVCSCSIAHIRLQNPEKSSGCHPEATRPATSQSSQQETKQASVPHRHGTNSCLGVRGIKLQDLHEELPCMWISPANACCKYGKGNQKNVAEACMRFLIPISSACQGGECWARLASCTARFRSTHAKENRVSTSLAVTSGVSTTLLQINGCGASFGSCL